MEHQFEDRLALAPYVGSNIKLIGVVIRINSILYDRYKGHKQVVVASVYDMEHDIQLDHINLMLRVSQANKLYLYEPISFCGKVTKYLARHYLSELDNMVVYKKTYGIATVRQFKRFAIFQLLNYQNGVKVGYKIQTWILINIVNYLMMGQESIKLFLILEKLKLRSYFNKG